MTFATIFSAVLQRKTAPLAIALALLASGCSLLAPEERQDKLELEHSWRVWQARRTPQYRYVQQRLCFCPTEAVSPVVVTVSNDIVVDQRYASADSPIPIQLSGFWGTIDDLFRLIERAIEEEAASLHVTYHSTLGYPTHISIDYRTNVADDEIVVTATKLEPVSSAASR